MPNVTAGTGRRLRRRARGRPQEPPAGAALSPGARICRGGRTRMANPCAGPDARWCNLRPRRRAPAHESIRGVRLSLCFGRRGHRTRCPTSPRPGNPRRKMEPASPDLRQRLRVASRRLGLTAFWRWWAGELVPLIPLPTAQRGRSHAHATRAGVRRERRRALGARGREPSSRLQGSGAHSVVSGDQDATAAAGRAAIDALSPSTVARRESARGGRRVARKPGSAQDDHPAGRGRGQPRPGALVRPRPAHAVQARRSVFRRRHRRARSRQEGAARRLGGGAQDRRGAIASARGKLGRDGDRRHARSRRGGPLAARHGRSISFPKRSDRTLRRGADGRSGYPSR